MKNSFDAITLEVLWSRLISIVDEAAAALRRASFSTVLRESNDFACVLLDAQGNSLAQSSISIPSFIGTLPRTVKQFLRLFPPDTLMPGDIIMTNDPWLGTGHLPDISMAKPLFRNGHLVAFAGSSGHLPDIGGRIRSQDAKEVFEEGLHIPPVKFIEQGRMDPMLELIIRANVRVPDQVMGDLMAHIAAAQTTEYRLQHLMDEYSLEDLATLAQIIQGRSQWAMEEAIETIIPPGQYSHEVRADDVEEGPIVIRNTVTVGNRRIKVDYTGTSPQVNRSLNVVATYAFSYTAYPIKCLLCPEVPNNEGCFRPIEVTAPEGAILNARFPASVGARAIMGHFLPEALFGALAKAIPDRVLAASGSPLWGVNLTGFHKNGAKFAGLFFINGGMGGSARRDGISAISFPSNISNTPVEVMENIFPIVVERKQLIPDSGGAGEHRGGCGQQLDVRIDSHQAAIVSFMADRTQYPGDSLMGGKRGFPGQVLLDGQPIPAKDQRLVYPGQVVTLRTPGGAGYGDPIERDRSLVKKDLADGLVTPDKARSEYGLQEG